MSNLVIITAFLESKSILSGLIKSDDYVICIDGGYDIAKRNHISPDLLMGDFDSIISTLPDDVPIMRFPPEKDYTDLELALKKAVELKAENVTIIGGIGGRLDHTIANIQLLSSYNDCFKSLVMLDGRNKCFIASRHMVIPAEENSYISLFSLSEKCEGVSASGVKYPLKNHTLTRDFPLGVSNEFKEKSAILSVEDGTLLVIVSQLES